MRKRKVERNSVSLEQYGTSLDTESLYTWDDQGVNPMTHLIMEEIRISCLQGVLLCLDRDHRITFLLFEIFDITGKQGAQILGISPQTFRKRISRARSRMKAFFFKNCALINPANPCKCERYAAPELERGVTKDELVFTNHSCRAKSDQNILNRLRELKELNKINELYRSYTGHRTPESCTDFIKGIINSNRFDLIRC